MPDPRDTSPRRGSPLGSRDHAVDGAAPLVVYVLNSVGPTSSPFNEYVLFRARRYADERCVVATLLPPDEAILASLEPYRARVRWIVGGGHPWRFLRELAGTIRRSRDEGGPVVVHLHHPATGAMFQMIRPLPGVRGTPVVYTVHNVFDKYTPKNKVLASMNIASSDDVVFVSRSGLEACPPWLRTRKGDAARVIVNGVDLERVDDVIASVASADVAGGTRSTGFRLVTVGRLLDVKNQELLVRAVAAGPGDTSLTVIGHGPLRDRLTALGKKLGLGNRLELTGLIPRDEVFRRMVSSDAFVSSSRWEGLPVAVLEAMACRLPVVLSDIGPHRELALQGSGVTVVPFDVAAWTAAIGRLAASGPGERADIGAAHRRATEEHFSLEAMQAAYRLVYERAWSRAGVAS